MTHDEEMSFLSDKHLARLAGGGAFARGEKYYRQGRVRDLDRTGSRIVAVVDGSQVYRADLTLSRNGLDGVCICPASGGFDFCKHCVAAALAYRAELNGEPVEAPAEKSSSGKSVGGKAVARESTVEAAIAPAELKKRITAAFPFPRDGLFRYAQVSTYFSRAEPLMDLLESQAPLLSPEQLLKLVDYAQTRLYRALETIDDSGGFRLHCEGTLKELHIEAMQRLDWSAQHKAQYLHELSFAHDGREREDWYAPIPEAYREVLGDEGMAAFLAILRQQWDALPKPPAGSDWSLTFRFSRIRDPLLEDARQRGDLEAVLSLYRKTANQRMDCIHAVRDCIEHQAWDLAEHWLELADEAHSSTGRWQADVDRLRVTLWEHQEKADEAAELQWRIYQQTRELSDYQRLDSQYRQRVVDGLSAKLPEPQSTISCSSRFPLNICREATQLVEIHLAEGDTDAALAICRQWHTTPTTVRQLLARLKDRPEDSLELFLQLIRGEVEQANDRGYRNAIGLLERYRKTLKTSTQQETLRHAIDELREVHQKKRKFIGYMDEAGFE
ncbi:hypothetical protein BJB45_20135 [Halomonas huangheensis]|uniref:SWIM-type domain-containing protein n=2 Tax=Halomonas huangheensis TaxID=1178482 RepID=W1N5Y0_9GAMM|nr:hypothetical protein AR456_20295 [Halomonas huangheensis]ERL50909.1 hypothetical protein BJB45_20135 [Halomonas huangheensis]